VGAGRGGTSTVKIHAHIERSGCSCERQTRTAPVTSCDSVVTIIKSATVEVVSATPGVTREIAAKHTTGYQYA
jgi:hypothetical protein